MSGWPSFWLLFLGQTRKSDAPCKAQPVVPAEEALRPYPSPTPSKTTLLLITTPPQCRRREVPRAEPCTEIVHLLVVVQPIDEVVAILEVVQRLERTGEHRHLVVADRMAFLKPDQLVVFIEQIHRQDLPAVLVDIEATLVVGMAETLAQARFDDPHAVQLVAQQFRVERAWPHDLAIGNTLLVHRI